MAHCTNLYVHLIASRGAWSWMHDQGVSRSGLPSTVHIEAMIPILIEKSLTGVTQTRFEYSVPSPILLAVQIRITCFDARKRGQLTESSEHCR